jgi:hypothetical protein
MSIMARTPKKKGAGSGRPFHTTTLIERPHVRITHTVIHPRAIIPPHPHELDYTIYPVTDFNVKRTYHENGKVVRTVRMVGKKGQPYKVKGARPGVHISIHNDSDRRMEFEKTLDPSGKPRSAGRKAPRKR